MPALAHNPASTFSTWLLTPVVFCIGCGFGGALRGSSDLDPPDANLQRDGSEPGGDAGSRPGLGTEPDLGTGRVRGPGAGSNRPPSGSVIEFGLQAAPDPQPEYGGRVFAVTDQASLDAANSAASPGDVLEIANGTYTSWDFQIRAHGSASKRLVVRPESPLGVTFSGGSQVRLDGDHVWLEGMQFVSTRAQALVVGGSDNRATRNSFVGCGTSGEETIKVVNVVTGFEFDNNEVADSYRQSILTPSPAPGESLFLGTQGNNFHHNYFHDIAKRVANGAEILTSPDGKTTKLADLVRENYGNRFEYNLVVNANGDAEYLSLKNGGWIIRYNRFLNSSGTLTLRSSSNSHIEGNQIVDSGGIRITGTNNVIINNHYSGNRPALVFHHGYDNPDGTPSARMATNNLIAHNTLRTSSRVISTLTRSSPLVFVDVAQGNLLVNNVFWMTSSGDWVGGANSDSFRADNTWRHNIVWNDAMAPSQGEVPNGAGNRGTDPGLKLEDGLYRPAGPDSAVVDTGESGISPVDLVLGSRDGSPDTGAVEYVH